MRRSVIAIAVIAAIAVLAGPAAATVVFADAAVPRSARIRQRWLVRLALPLPSATIIVHIAPCPNLPNADGCSAPGVIWLRPGVANRALLLHELGHQFDYTQQQWVRTAFEVLNHDGRPWGSEPNGPSEQFAEAWMGCAAPDLAAGRYDTATGRYEFAYGYRPSWNGLKAACKLVRRAAREIVAARASARQKRPGAAARGTSPT